MGIVFKNNAKTTLSSAVNNSTTTIPVTDGSVFPAVNLSGAGTFFLLTLDDESNNEIVKVTSCSGASGNINLTVIRAQEGTTARAFSSGNKAELRFTSGTIDEIRSDNTVHTNIFTTANNSTTDFTLSDEVANENDLVVFIDGVFQAHNTFSVSGTTLTLATAPESGRVVTVYSIKGSRSASNVALATMTGDNSDTTLTLPVEPINENSVQVFFDGVYQNKDSFSISGTTLTFGVAPPTGVAVEALVFTKLAINTSSILSDTDADTKVQVEESSDEDKIRFDTGGTERMIIDDAGKVGLGTTSPVVPLDILTNLSSDTTSSPDTVLTIATKYASTSANGVAGAGPRLEFKIPDDETNPITGAAIAGLKENGDDSVANAALAFYISQNDTTLDEAMRIDSAGKVGIGDTSPDAMLKVVSNNAAVVGSWVRGDYYGLRVSGGSTSSHYALRIANSSDATLATFNGDGKVMIGGTSPSDTFQVNGTVRFSHAYGTGTAMIINNTNANNNYIPIGFHDNGTSAGYIFVNGSLDQTSYVTSSDYRLKENVNYSWSATEKLKQLKPAEFNMIKDEENIVLSGFLAHEVESILPQAITGEKDAVDENGDPIYQGIDHSKLVPLLTKAIQELTAKVEQLEGKIE